MRHQITEKTNRLWKNIRSEEFEKMENTYMCRLWNTEF